MSHDDFVIQIGPDIAGGYAISVVKSPAGEGAGSLHLPFDGFEVGRMLAKLGGTVRGDQEPREEVENRNLSPVPITTEEARHSPREVGAALFRALFAGQVRSLFDQSLGKARGEENGGLRIQIKLNPEHPDLARLYSLPWELLYRPETQDFLSLSRSSPIVRYLDVSRPTTPYPLPSPLRILVAMASPKGLPPLDLRRERHNIETAWGRQNSVDVIFLDHASPGAIREELLERPCHVLHFMGHGGFDRRSGEGVLYLEGADGAPLAVSGHVLAAKLKDFRSLRLVFLNACETARAASEAGVNPFAGVATALVLGGIPSVLAMQFPISDGAAIAFSRAFYRRLAAGDPVDTAATEGRQAVHSENAASYEWATPVLFLRTPDGHLFSRSSQVAAKSSALASPTSTSLLIGKMGGAASRRKSRRLPLFLLFLVLSGASVASWALRGTFGFSRGFAPSASEEAGRLSAESGAAGGEPSSDFPGLTDVSGRSGPTILRAKPKPITTLEIGEPFRSSYEGFTGLVSKVELRDDRMRWYFHFLNQTDSDKELSLNLAATYVADEDGTAYRVLDAEGVADPRDWATWTIQVGVRLDWWMELPLGEGGDHEFTVGLVTHDRWTNYPEFRPFQVKFPPVPR